MKKLRHINDKDEQDQSVQSDAGNDSPVVLSKLEKKTKNNKKTKSTKIPTKSKSNISEDIQQHSHEQIVDIRHSDESTREHVRHSFLKRWDGISNELQLTQSQLGELSPIHQVYWKIKSKNMNVVIFQELGKRQYMAFENDAIKLSEMFKKQIRVVNRSLAVTFWFKEIEVAKRELFLRKIPVMVMNEIDDPEYRQLHGFVRREVVEVQTPGLHLNIEDLEFKERLTLAIFKNKDSFGFVVLDSQNNHFNIGQLQDDEYLHEIRRVVNRYRPVEVIVPDKGHRQIGQIAKTICNPYVVEVKLKMESVRAELLKFRICNSSYFFQELLKRFTEQDIKEDQFSNYNSVCVLSLIWQYLQSLSLLEKIFCQGLFHGQAGEMGARPFFDSQAYQNLQIFRIKNEDQGYAKPGTLMAYLNKCVTLQGKKELHRWIDQPLQNLHQIKRRQQAIRELVQDKPSALILHQKLTAYERFDKRITDIYHWVIRNSEQGKLTLTRSINFQKQYDQKKNPAIARLKQIIQILKLFQRYEDYLRELRKFDIKSEYLLQYIELIPIDNIHVMSLEQISKIEGIPEIGYVAETILRKFDYDEVTEHLQPAVGIYEVFDSQKQKMEEVHHQLEKELMKWKEYFNSDRVVYVSVRARNQIQVPKALTKNKKHQDLIFSSEVATAVRYSTARTYELNQQLIQHETVLSQTFQPFLQEVVRQFCSYRYLWDLYIQSMASVDVLMSLAKVSKNMVPRCLPKFDGDRLTIKRGCNVSLLQVKNNVTPNTINLVERQRILLLTGPNMGGKSTLLKQTCLLAIMAQMGCYVPAEEYNSIVFDQIFCRIGASDRIYQGKSTFYVELQQTKRIIDKATKSSLVIIDELGRGTSTYDGMAIAESVIDYILNRIGCFTLFSTHYSQITQRFERRSDVRLMKMSSELEGQDLVFTYQLVEGIAEKSFASNVGRMVGLPKEILDQANKKSELMHHQTKRKQRLREACFLAGVYPSKPTNKQIKPQSVIGDRMCAQK